MRRRDVLPLLALAPLAAAPAARAECPRGLLAAVSPLGWAMYEEQGQLRGVAVDLLKRLAALADCPIQLSVRPRARTLLDFQNAEVDLIASVARTADRDLAGDFEPYAYSGNELILDPDRAAAVSDLASLERQEALKLGLVRGVNMPGAIGALVERLVRVGRVEWAVDYQNLALRMARDRVAVGLFPVTVHRKLSHDGDLPARFRAVPLPESPPQPIGLYVSHRVPEGPRKALIEALRTLVRRGEVQRLYARYLGDAAARSLFDAGRAAAGGLPV